jgi:hypothetical protein
VASYASVSERQVDSDETMEWAVDALAGYVMVLELARSGWKVKEKVEGCCEKVSRDVYAT